MRKSIQQGVGKNWNSKEKIKKKKIREKFAIRSMGNSGMDRYGLSQIGSGQAKQGKKLVILLAGKPQGFKAELKMKIENIEKEKKKFKKILQKI